MLALGYPCLETVLKGISDTRTPHSRTGTTVRAETSSSCASVHVFRQGNAHTRRPRRTTDGGLVQWLEPFAERQAGARVPEVLERTA